MAMVRVPMFCPFRKNLLDDRHSDTVEKDGYKEKVDVGFSEFPICALSDHREGQYEKTGKACLGELQMRLEEFAESPHRMLDELWICNYFFTTNYYTPNCHLLRHIKFCVWYDLP